MTGRGANEEAPRSFKIAFDFPPMSANGMYVDLAGRRRRTQSGAYQRWAKRFAHEVMVTRPAKLPLDFTYVVEIRANINRRRDIDNLAKPILDQLCANGITPDDKWCDRIVVTRDCTIKGFTVEAWVSHPMSTLRVKTARAA